MKLDFQSIKEAISEEFSIISCDNRRDGRFYGFPIFYSETSPIENESVLIMTTASDLPELPQYVLLISIGPLYGTIDKSTTAYLELSQDTDAMSVMNCLQRLFHCFNTICDRLNHIYTKGKGVQALLDLMLPVFENPIYVHDKNYRMFAYAENREDSREKWTYDFYSSGRLSPQTIQRLTQSPHFANTFQTVYPTYYVKDATIEDYNYLYVNLRKKGQYFGRLFVDEKIRPIKAFDYPCLDVLAHYIELILVQGKTSSDPQSRLLPTRLSQLIEGRQMDAQTSKEIRQELGWPEHYRFRCFKLTITGDDDYQNIGVGLSELINEKTPGGFAFPYENNVLALINLKDQRNDLIDRWILPLTINFNLKVGISRVAADLNQLAHCYKQTELALNCISEDDPSPRIEFYDSHLLDLLLNNTLEKMPASMICPESLLRLISYDRSNCSDYVKTLRAYFECNLSPTKASEQLFIHRSSFLYRLDKIVEITEENFHDNETQILYRLMFYLMDMNPTLL